MAVFIALDYAKFTILGGEQAMEQFSYLAVLGVIAICAIGVNFAFALKISQFWRTFLKVDLTILVIYVAWDVWAVSKGSWRFDPSQIIGIFIPGHLPIEELLFFILVPLMTVLCYLSLIRITGMNNHKKDSRDLL
ncbi:unannotated protein [freshwater metagenome]|uniref:Unannotated protein n=1 Tax=freshwater metagenome TaxID=449393 RepID=A0A6J7XY84_9ZZZZ|nr:lycopene cyclase domain-containing protein [Actinomycetota bacterium]